MYERTVNSTGFVRVSDSFRNGNREILHVKRDKMGKITGIIAQLQKRQQGRFILVSLVQLGVSPEGKIVQKGWNCNSSTNLANQVDILKRNPNGSYSQVIGVVLLPKERQRGNINEEIAKLIPNGKNTTLRIKWVEGVETGN